MIELLILLLGAGLGFIGGIYVMCVSVAECSWTELKEFRKEVQSQNGNLWREL
jgi:hypothetical protein